MNLSHTKNGAIFWTTLYMNAVTRRLV